MMSYNSYKSSSGQAPGNCLRLSFLTTGDIDDDDDDDDDDEEERDNGEKRIMRGMSEKSVEEGVESGVGSVVMGFTL